MNYPPVLTKLNFVRRYSAGEFGNSAPTWLTINSYLQSGYGGSIHMRNRVAGAETWYDLAGPQEVVNAFHKATAIGWKPDQLYFSAMAPTAKTLIQGEVMQTYRGLELYYSTVAKPMRDALRERSETVTGIIASLLLRHYLCPDSYEWLQVLLDRYPSHVVEFSTYCVEWGTLPGYNSVFWEVRSY